MKKVSSLIFSRINWVNCKPLHHFASTTENTVQCDLLGNIVRYFFRSVSLCAETQTIWVSFIVVLSKNKWLFENNPKILHHIPHRWIWWPPVNMRFPQNMIADFFDRCKIVSLQNKFAHFRCSQKRGRKKKERTFNFVVWKVLQAENIDVFRVVWKCYGGKSNSNSFGDTMDLFFTILSYFRLVYLRKTNGQVHTVCKKCC